MKARAIAESILPDQPAIVGAFFATTGSRPGAEGLLEVFGLVGAGLAALISYKREKHVVAGEYVVAVTDRSVVLLKARGRRRKRTWFVESQYDNVEVLGPFRDEMCDSWIEIDRKKFWVPLIETDEARRLTRRSNR